MDRNKCLLNALAGIGTYTLNQVESASIWSWMWLMMQRSSIFKSHDKAPSSYVEFQMNAVIWQKEVGITHLKVCS